MTGRSIRTALVAPFTWLALLLIAAYRRWLSPLKGYSCAYRIYCGGTSCSTYGTRAIERHGVILGVAILRRRFGRCSTAYYQYREARPISMRSSQAGFCDGCDVPSCDFPCECGNREYCEYLDLCDCCNWGDEKKKRRNRT
ncbi:MAG: membrane protein insertion efficiency factor YidD [Pseudomonadota bacterium]